MPVIHLLFLHTISIKAIFNTRQFCFGRIIFVQLNVCHYNLNYMNCVFLYLKYSVHFIIRTYI